MNFLLQPFVSLTLTYHIPYVWAFFIWYAIQFLAIAILMLAFAVVYAVFEVKITSKLSGEKNPQTSAISAIKSIFKNNETEYSDKFSARFTPLFTIVPIIFVWFLMPFSSSFLTVRTDVGMLLFFALMLFPIVGNLFNSISANDKYQKINELRSCIQSTLFVVPTMLVLAGVSVLANSFSLQYIVAAQKNLWFIIPSLLGFAVMIISTFAILNKKPLNALSNSISPLINFAKHIKAFILCAFTATLFLGGYLSPLPVMICDLFDKTTMAYQFALNFEQAFWLILKTFVLLLAIIKIKVSIPKIRTENVNIFVWKYLLPLSIINLMIVCLIKCGGFYA